MTKTFVSVLALAALLGVGCLASPQIVPAPEPVAEPWVTYATSGKIVITFDAPQDWFVRQSDMGGGSVVTIRKNKDAKPGVAINLELPATGDGSALSYEQWLERRELTTSTGSSNSSGRVFDVWQTDDGIAYTAAIDAVASEIDQYYLRVLVPADFDSAVAQQILESIDFAPTPEARSAASAIPEWSVEDTQ